MNYAVITKVKAMYGKRLTDSDISTLHGMDIESCAEFLKSHPAYARAFDGTDTRTMRLTELEELLRRQYYDDFTRLLKCLTGRDRRFADTLIKTYDIESILWALRSFDTELAAKAGFAEICGSVMKRYSELDFTAIINATDTNQLIRALPVHYGRILEKSKNDDGTVDYLSAETGLWKHYYTELSELVSKEFKKDDASVMTGTYTDLHNIMRIFRLREYFKYSAGEIIPYLLTPSYRLTDSQITRLCETNGIKEFTSVLNQTSYKPLSEASDAGIEKLAYGFLHNKSGRMLHFSQSAAAVVYSYLLYKRDEAVLIKAAVESVRYKMAGR